MFNHLTVSVADIHLWSVVTRSTGIGTLGYLITEGLQASPSYHDTPILVCSLATILGRQESILNLTLNPSCVSFVVACGNNLSLLSCEGICGPLLDRHHNNRIRLNCPTGTNNAGVNPTNSPFRGSVEQNSQICLRVP
jgi:hypothetical protein